MTFSRNRLTGLENNWKAQSRDWLPDAQRYFLRACNLKSYTEDETEDCSADTGNTHAKLSVPDHIYFIWILAIIVQPPRK